MPNISDADLAKLKKDIATAAGQQVAEAIRMETQREIAEAKRGFDGDVSEIREHVKQCMSALNTEIIAFGTVLAPLRDRTDALCGPATEPLADPDMSDLPVVDHPAPQYIHQAIGNLRTVGQGVSACMLRLCQFTPPPDDQEELALAHSEIARLKSQLAEYGPSEDAGNNPEI